MPGHIGIERNEKVDELARRGNFLSWLSQNLFCGVGDAFFREEVIVTKIEGLCWDVEILKD